MATSVPCLETRRLLLKPVTVDDAPAIQRAFADYAIVRQLSNNVPWPYPPDGAKAYLQSAILPFMGASVWAWGLHLKVQPDGIIGVIELRRQAIRGNRGFWLARKHWGNGLMSEAAEITTEYAFEVLEFDELIFENAASNEASARLKRSVGAELVAIRPGSFVDPMLTQAEVWRLTREGWHKHRSRS